MLDGEERAPRVVVTDKLASYPPALRRVLLGVEHRRHKGLNNRAENSHRPVRKRERVLGCVDQVAPEVSSKVTRGRRNTNAAPPVGAGWTSRVPPRRVAIC